MTWKSKKTVKKSNTGENVLFLDLFGPFQFLHYFPALPIIVTPFAIFRIFYLFYIIFWQKIVRAYKNTIAKKWKDFGILAICVDNWTIYMDFWRPWNYPAFWYVQFFLLVPIHEKLTISKYISKLWLK